MNTHRSAALAPQAQVDPGMKKILIVEDDYSIAKTLELVLKTLGYESQNARSIEESKRLLSSDTFDVALVDINLPDGTSFGLCDEIKQNYPDIIVVVITANLDEESAVRTLSLGAADYIRKPFGQRELKLRLQRALSLAPERIWAGPLEINLRSARVTYKKEPICLTATELRLLTVLIKDPGGLITRKTLLFELDPEARLQDQTLNSHLANLRAKLNRAGAKEVQIQSLRGIGYRLEIK